MSETSMLTGIIVGLILLVLIGLACMGVAMAHAADDEYDDEYDDPTIYELRLPSPEMVAAARQRKDESEAKGA